MSHLEWSLKDCTVIVIDTVTKKQEEITGFAEEAVQGEYMGDKYEDLEQSADGEHSERYATNDNRIKIVFGLYGGTKAALIFDNLRHADSSSDGRDILVRNRKIGREMRCDTAKAHKTGAVTWGKKHGNRTFEFQGPTGHLNREI